MLGTVVEVIGVVFLALGLLLATIGLYGMLRRPAIFEQLHAAGLITGPAIVLVLLASIATRNVHVITSAALLVLFLLVTSPLSTHAIAQAAYRRARGERTPARPEA
jgi:monovalent cation/proton antiporter MnhG/PhaG subunit